MFGLLQSGRRGSNSRQPAWKAGALPTELLPHYCGANISTLSIFANFSVKKNEVFSLSAFKLFIINLLPN